MKILAVIPARAGSKRLPGKNIRLLGGKPLIQWSIQSALDIGAEVCDVLVSTDDQGIAAVSKECGAMVPWLRPSNLAADDSKSVDVCLHALDWYEREIQTIDALLLLQPTSPFRSRESIKKGIDIFRGNPDAVVLGVSDAKCHPRWCFRLNNEELSPYVNEHGLRMRTQELEKVYAINGSFYLLSVSSLRENQSLFGKRMLPLIMDDPSESIDIDTGFDWIVAEAVMSLHTHK